MRRASETKTKIVCTIGPASNDEETLRRMIRAGMDVVRVNFSHGTHEEHGSAIERVRRITLEEGATVGVMADLQGPKLRIGRLSTPLRLAPGDWISLTTRPADGSHHAIPIPHPEIIRGSSVGQRLLLDDGDVEVVVREVRVGILIGQVIVGTCLSSHKGIAAPEGTLDIPALTAKDIEDARFALSCGVDFIALSFVQSAKDIDDLRCLVADTAPDNAPQIIAKIERREAVENLETILAKVDALMVARGDLGIALSSQEVPLLQKRIIRESNRMAIPVITATQMLQSMIDHPRPTRAESSDVANAILDGTDAVMLSAETAVGRYPVESVEMIREISRAVEKGMPRESSSDRDVVAHVHPITDAIGAATAAIADRLDARLIATMTQTGYTARQIARKRPRQPIVAFTPSDRVARQLSLVWGATPVVVDGCQSTDEMIETVSEAVLSREEANRGDLVVITGGIPAGGGGKTNFVTVHRI